MVSNYLKNTRFVLLSTIFILLICTKTFGQSEKQRLDRKLSLGLGIAPTFIAIDIYNHWSFGYSSAYHGFASIGITKHFSADLEVIAERIPEINPGPTFYLGINYHFGKPSALFKPFIGLRGGLIHSNPSPSTCANSINCDPSNILMSTYGVNSGFNIKVVSSLRIFSQIRFERHNIQPISISQSTLGLLRFRLSSGIIYEFNLTSKTDKVK